MSYAYAFGEEAMAQFRRLDPWLAEETLDELDLLLKDPPLSRRRIAGGFVHDFVRQRTSDVVYVFLTIAPDTRRKILNIRSIGVYSRPVPVR